MMTARSFAILFGFSAALLVAPPAHAKRRKAAPAPAAEKSNSVDSSPTEEAGSIPVASSKETSDSDSEAKGEAKSESRSESKSSSRVAQESPSSSTSTSTKGESSDTEDETPKPRVKVAAQPVEPAAPVVAPAYVPRKSSGNADSPEGVTWKASGWDVTLYGYVGLNIMQDSTQSFGTASSNTIIQRRGTPRGNNLQAQATARDSRLGFRLAPPLTGSIRASVNIEMDFNAPAPIEYNEASVVTQAAMRMRHYYMKVETPIVDLLAGQYHDLFGWGGKGFYPSTLAFLGITGEVYHRKPQVRLSKTIEGGGVEFEIAAAALAPVQKNGGYPDVEAGLRVALGNWTGARQQAYGQPAIGRAGLGLSAIGRHFEVSEFIENPVRTVPGTGYGVAADLFLPIIPATNVKDRGNSLSFTGEFSIGTGIADMYSDLTGGLLFPSLPNSMNRTDPTNPPPVYTPNIDTGIVTFDADGRLRTANWQGLVLNLQYYLPVAGGRVWVAATHSEIKSSNIQSITPPQGWGGIYTHAWYNDASLFVAITDAVQLGIAVQRTHQWLGPPATMDAEPVLATNWRTELGLHMFF
jgi:hypothetical protein